MIKLTRIGANLPPSELYVPENIVVVNISGDTTILIPGIEQYYTVSEPAEEVARKVLEYRLMMADYARESDSDYSNKPWAYHRLHMLSGLSAEKGADNG